jgi:iron(III) transport system permease protein
MAFSWRRATDPPAAAPDGSALVSPWHRALGSWRGRDVGWAALALLIAGLLAVPTLAVLTSIFIPTGEIWAHLVSTVLPNYVRNTFGLLLGVGLGVLVIGVGAAWLVTMCRFPGRGLCTWALLLPLAMPAYIIAYTYTDLFQYAGSVQSALRAWFGWRRGDYWFPDVRSLLGAIVVMTLVFYPYVYLLARAAFLEQSASLFEISRVLGRGPWRSFATVALPLARPAIVGGVALALMEALADFGAVQYFAVDTFTTGIYRTWFGMGSLPAAAQLAAVLLSGVFAVLLLERLARGRARVHHASRGARLMAPFALSGPRAAAALVACLLPVVGGFVVPSAVLVQLALTRGDARAAAVFTQLAFHSFVLAAVAALAAVAVATLLAYGLRIAPNPVTRLATRVAVLGYAVPGAVIAVGILIAFGWLDQTFDRWARAATGSGVGLVLSGTVAALVLAYLVRFLAAAFNTVEATLGKITPSLDEVPRTLGASPGRTLLRVHVPLLRGGLLTAALLVFVEVMKELPATLVVRPFNFDTLAIRVYRLASDERLAEASTAALAIVAVGLLPVIVLSLAVARAGRDPSTDPAVSQPAIAALPGIHDE